MDNDDPGTVTIWQSGRLAPRVTARHLEFTREHMIAAAMLVLSALVMTAYVAVLEKDVDRSVLARQAQRAQPPAQTWHEPPPENTAYDENEARAATVSLLATR